MNLPKTLLQVYHFTAKSCEKLKKENWPKESGEYVSTYDCVSAITWQAMTKARMPYLKGIGVNSSSTTTFYHAIDSRGRFGSSVLNEYFGNGASMACTKPIDIGSLLGKRGSALAAQAIRQSILNFKESSISDTLKVRRGIEGREKMEFDWSPPAVVATSWMGMKALTGYDFGFGLPATIRTTVPPFEGVLGVLPAATEIGKNDGIEMFVCMEKGCQERMATDAEYLAYCQISGHK